MGIGRMAVGFLEEGKEWRLPSLLSADNLALSGESEQDLREMIGACDRIRMKIKVKISKTVVLVRIKDLKKLKKEDVMNVVLKGG